MVDVVSTMSFIPDLKDFLYENRRIYTVRKFDMQRAMVHIEGVGMCTREPLGKIESFEELETYVDMSGFSTLSAWKRKICQFIPKGESMYLYLVKVVQNGQ